jgi:hypothetical protein
MKRRETGDTDIKRQCTWTTRERKRRNVEKSGKFREREIERLGEIKKGESAKDGAAGKWVKNP